MRIINKKSLWPIALIPIGLMLASCARLGVQPAEPPPDEPPVLAALCAMPLSVPLQAKLITTPSSSPGTVNQTATSADKVTPSYKSIKLKEAISKTFGHEPVEIEKAVQAIKQNEVEHGVPPTLMAAVIQKESKFTPSAKSPGGAVGLSQIQPDVWGSRCHKIWTVEGNVECGAKVLSAYYEESGSWNKALAYYNVGPSNYSKSRAMRIRGDRYARVVLQHQKSLEIALNKR